MNKKDTARIITTWDCNRSCPGCCNQSLQKPSECTPNLFRNFDKFVITGGEPMLYPDGIYRLIMSQLPEHAPKYLQTAYIDIDNDRHKDTLELFDGLNYTIHHQFYAADIDRLAALTQYMYSEKPKFAKSSHLIVDDRIYNSFRIYEAYISPELSKVWSKITRLQWKDDCPVPNNEELLYYDVTQH